MKGVWPEKLQLPYHSSQKSASSFKHFSNAYESLFSDRQGASYRRMFRICSLISSRGPCQFYNFRFVPSQEGTGLVAKTPTLSRNPRWQLTWDTVGQEMDGLAQRHLGMMWKRKCWSWGTWGTKHKETRSEVRDRSGVDARAGKLAGNSTAQGRWRPREHGAHVTRKGCSG